jgi:hypothetical protein
LLIYYLSIEELLIDFRELVGEHSGENMADVVWEVLLCFNIQDKVYIFLVYFRGQIFR